MRLFNYFICAVVIPCVLSCMPGTTDLHAVLRIACIGDSITEGAWLEEPATESYPSRLQAILGTRYSVGNYGASGACMLKNADGPYWNTESFLRLFSDTIKPAIVVLMLGTNDSKPYNWMYKEEFAQDYRDMIDTLSTLSPSVEIRLCLPPPAHSNAFDISGTVIHNEIVPIINQIALERGLKIIDCHTPFLTHPEKIPDGVHPDKDGAEYLAQIVSHAILSH